MSIFELIDAGDAASVQALIERESDALGVRDDSGLSPLMHAAYRGRDAVFHTVAAHSSADPWDRLLLGESDGLPAPDAWTPDGFTGLHLAAFSGNVGAARSLLDAGADPNVLATASFAQVTPLGTCAFVGANDVARLLLEHGARLDVFAAAMVGDAEAVKAVLDVHPEMRDATGPHGIPLAAHATGAVRELFT